MCVNLACNDTQGVALSKRYIGRADDDVSVGSQGGLQREALGAGHSTRGSNITSGQSECSKGIGVTSYCHIRTRIILNDKRSARANGRCDVANVRVIDFLNNAVQSILRFDSHLRATDVQLTSALCTYLLRSQGK